MSQQLTLAGPLVLALVAEGAVIAALIVSIVRPSHRIWPPGDVSWKFWYYWGNVAITAVALATVGYAAAGNFVFTGRLWTWIGGLLIVTGAAFAGWAGRTLQIHTIGGLGGELHTDGPYQYTRNPQLVGLSAVLVGVLFAVNSSYLVVGTLPVFVWIALLPVAEEPWLEEQFGDEYEAYRREVPRFAGLRTITNLFGYSR